MERRGRFYLQKATPYKFQLLLALSRFRSTIRVLLKKLRSPPNDFEAEFSRKKVSFLSVKLNIDAAILSLLSILIEKVVSSFNTILRSLQRSCNLPFRKISFIAISLIYAKFQTSLWTLPS